MVKRLRFILQPLPRFIVRLKPRRGVLRNKMPAQPIFRQNCVKQRFNADCRQDKTRRGTGNTGGFHATEVPARSAKDTLFKSPAVRLLFGEQREEHQHATPVRRMRRIKPPFLSSLLHPHLHRNVSSS